MKWNGFFGFSALLCGGLLLCGCVQHEVKVSKVRVGSSSRKTYQAIDASNLKLDMVSTRELKVGGGGEITFALTNLGKKPVKIPEWFVNEPDNLRISCQLWTPDMKDPYPDAWVSLDEEVKKPDTRYPLELEPGNRVLITRILPFVDALKLRQGYERRYFLRGELNLTSVKLTSPIVGVAIRAPRPGENPKGDPQANSMELGRQLPRRPVPPRSSGGSVPAK